MKQLPLIFMFLTIFSGLLLTFTAFMMSYFFPVTDEQGQYASPVLAANELKHWFHAPEDIDFYNVKAIRQVVKEKGVISRFSFSVDRVAVVSFIQRSNLKQKEITTELMEEKLKLVAPDWWQPEALTRETYFTVKHQGQDLILIYNDQTKQGLLQISGF